MGLVKCFAVVGLIFSFIAPTNGKTHEKAETTKRILSSGKLQKYSETRDKGKEFDDCLIDPDSNDQEILNSFIILDKNGVHSSKCKKENPIDQLEKGSMSLGPHMGNPHRQFIRFRHPNGPNTGFTYPHRLFKGFRPPQTSFIRPPHIPDEKIRPPKGFRTPYRPFIRTGPPHKPFKGFRPPYRPVKGFRPPHRPFIGIGPPHKPFKGFRPPHIPVLGIGPPHKQFKGFRPPHIPFLGIGPQHKPVKGFIPRYRPLKGVRHLHGPYRGVRDTHIMKRNFLYGTGRWPNGVVSYKIRPGDFSFDSEEIIRNAMKEISQKTCIVFKEQVFPAGQTGDSWQSQSIPFIYIRKTWHLPNAGDCESEAIGRTGSRQIVLLHQQTCMTRTTLVHLLLHVLGMTHEQSRSDRDRNVGINWGNIKTGQTEKFQKQNTDNKSPYDISSLMQFGLSAYSKDGQNTIHAKYKLGFIAGTSTSLNFYDQMGIVGEYKCAAKCPSMTCYGGGFVNHKCQCECPPGLAGTQCDWLDTDYDCGAEIQINGGETDITSPNYPSSYPIGKKCVWFVGTLAHRRIKVTFLDVDLPYSQSSGACYHWLEVRFNRIGQTGKRICGQSTQSAIITTPVGERNFILFIFDSRSVRSRSPGKGIKWHVEYIPDP